MSVKAIIVHPAYPLSSRDVETEQPKETHWDELPSDILHRIASHLPSARDLCNFSRICKSARSAADDDALWKELVVNTFNNTPRTGRPDSWKELYRFNHQILYDLLMCRRPDKPVEFGNGVLVINLGMVMA